MLRKCAVCRGPHEAWSPQWLTRREELVKTKAPYNMRQQYHAVMEPPSATTSHANGPRTLVRRQSLRELAQVIGTQANRDSSSPRRGRKRINAEMTITSSEKENQMEWERVGQRPQRASIPSRKLLEAVEANSINDEEELRVRQLP